MDKSDIEFLSAQLEAKITGDMMDGIDGLGFSLKKSARKLRRAGKRTVKRIGKRSTRMVKTAAKTPGVMLRAAKTVAYTPLKTAQIATRHGTKAAARYAQKDVKKTARAISGHSKRLVKDVVNTGAAVAPVAAIAAGAYFGGPAVMSAIKGTTAAGAVKAGKFAVVADRTVKRQRAASRGKRPPNNIKILFRDNKGIFERFKRDYPEEFERLKHQPPEIIIQSPVVKMLTAELIAAEEEKNLGVSIDSEEAYALAQAQGDMVAEEIAGEMATPKKDPVKMAAITGLVAIPLLFM